ncbi:MAG: hypothetical protein WBL85_01025 [Sedimentisphaerales bacterium]
MTPGPRIKQRNNRTSATVGGGIKPTDDIPVSFRYERLIIAGLCLAVAIRVFAFSAAFPFFNNVDEVAHFDLVFKYSRGHLPAASLEKYDPVAVEIIANSGGGGEFLGDHIDKTPDILVKEIDFLTNAYNYETWSFPSYYLLAGLWCRLGESLAITGAELLYWIRFLDVPLAVVFVWLSWLFSRRFFRDNFQERIAIPLLAAFFPQDIFYAITGDVLSPVVFAAALFMLLEIYLSEKSWKYHLFAGLLVAATFLAKASNIAIIPFAAFVVLIKVTQAVRQRRLRQYLFPPAALVIAALLPVVFWLGRNYILFGDAVGAAASAKSHTWTVKPLSEIFNHPIFTPSGFIYFISELTKTFWRGEFVWHNRIIASAFMDGFYVISSGVFLLALILDKTRSDGSCRTALAGSLFVVILSIVFLAFMSMRYDFGTCVYPSVAKPYFTSGRLIAGAILPFLILYIDGLRRILSKLRCASALLFVVGIIVAAITVSEIVLSWSVFANPDNWFHLIK